MPLPSFELEPPPPRASASAAVVRIRHVDSLRAVAAGLVVWTHFAEGLVPLSSHRPPAWDFLWTLPLALSLGRVGVLIFFAVSGFVILRSFDGPREGGAQRFVIKRLCRLYPAFAVSLLSGVLIWRTSNPLTWQILVANATMVPGLFRQPPLLGLYWTLALELFFYALCLALHVLGILDRRPLLYGAVVCLADLHRILHRVGLLFGVHYHLAEPALTWATCLAIMFWGAVFRLEYDATGGFRRMTHLWIRIAPLALLTLALPYLANAGTPWMPHVFVELPWRAKVLPCCALAIFTLWVGVLRVNLASMTYLGVISYSWYLFHPGVLSTFAPLLQRLRIGYGIDLPLWVTLPVSAGCSVLLAALVHAWVEQPGIAWGKRWAKTFLPGDNLDAPPLGDTRPSDHRTETANGFL